MKNFFSSFGVFLISDGGRLRLDNKLEKILSELVSNFPSILAVQIREQLVNSDYPPADDDYVIQLCALLKEKAIRDDFKVFINGNPELAIRAKASGVHLGANSIGINRAREILGNEPLIGYSAHSTEEIKSLNNELVDYTYLSPIFYPGSKQISKEPLGLETLRLAVKVSEIPIFALGGVCENNIQEIYETGVSGVSLISSILYSYDPVKSMSKLDKIISHLEKDFKKVSN